MDLTGMEIKDYKKVFHCTYAERAGEITWTKFPVATGSLPFRRLMASPVGHAAYCVFLGLIRLCARFRTGGRLVVKGEVITPDDIAGETGIPPKYIVPALEMLHSERIGWIVACNIAATSLQHQSATECRITAPRGAPASVSVSDSVSLSSLPEGECEGKPHPPDDRAHAPPGSVKPSLPAPARVMGVWNACAWKRVGRQAALKAIAAASRRVAAERFQGDEDAACEFLRVRAGAFSVCRMVASTPVQYLPHPATWFNAGRYDDDPREWAKERQSDGRESALIPLGGSSVDAILGQIGMEDGDGKARSGGCGEVLGQAFPALESDRGTDRGVG